MASLSINSPTVMKTGAACANSGKTTRRTGRNGAAPATAESIIDSRHSVFERIERRSRVLGKSVWQAAAEYRMSDIYLLVLGESCVTSSTAIDGSGDVTTRVLYVSRYLRRAGVNGYRSGQV